MVTLRILNLSKESSLFQFGQYGVNVSEEVYEEDITLYFNVFFYK